MSGDGRWLTLRKRGWMPVWKESDMDKDTLILFDLRNPEKYHIAGYRQNVWEMAFAGNHHLLLLYDRQTELLNLDKQTSTFFKGVKRIQVLNEEQFLLYYNPKTGNRLELRNISGEQVNAADSVSRFYTTEDNQVYAITENGENGNEILLLKDKATERIYETTHKIISLEAGSGEGIMICEQAQENGSQEIVYLDLINKTTYPLREVLPVIFQQGFSKILKEGSVYFLKLWVEKEKPENATADVWYGTDNRLEEKFYPPVKTLTYVWEPCKHAIRQIGDDDLTSNLAIGNDRYFLSFNPYLLQDYTEEQAPLQLYVYDRVKDRYSLPDTIAPELYLSGDGRYALSPKDGEWYLYHIPSRNKKLIPGKDLGTPWFPSDGQAVLFEGEGALWKYELKTGTLAKAVEFEGYQTSIINGETKTIATRKGRFYTKQVNVQEPLVVKLYNPEKNVSSYSLWKNGRFSTIVPPTARCIQNLVYNVPYTRFCYTEEDYDLPPRLVFKEMGKEGKILYQSNQEDKAILSLRQEIVSNTNSEGIPLKGILYYPLNYSTSQKYPMVVHIYGKQRQLSNRYPYPSYYEGVGFNVRLLIENGYFVYLPDIVIQGKEGPGIDALDCVNNALDALAGNPLIDKKRIGLIGHSFGGYETDFIATHSDRFAAYVSGSGCSDIVWAANSFNYNFHFPDYVRIKVNRYKMGVPFSENKALYLKNNPVYHAEKVNAPVLLWAGLEDQNVTSDHTMALYNALRRNKKDVVVLFYKGEGHSLQKPGAQFDLTSRIMDWFDYFLKERTDIEWVNKRLP